MGAGDRADPKVESRREDHQKPKRAGAKRPRGALANLMDHAGPEEPEESSSFHGLGLAQTCDPIAFLPLAAFAQDFHAFKALQNVALGAQGRGGPKTPML